MQMRMCEPLCLHPAGFCLNKGIDTESNMTQPTQQSLQQHLSVFSLMQGPGVCSWAAVWDWETCSVLNRKRQSALRAVPMSCSLRS